MAARRPRSQIQLHWIGLNAVMIVAIVLTAVSVVQTTHRCRQSYARLQMLQSAQWDTRENWSQLLLQESALATHYRVEQAAQQRLQMRAPTAADTRVVLR